MKANSLRIQDILENISAIFKMKYYRYIGRSLFYQQPNLNYLRTISHLSFYFNALSLPNLGIRSFYFNALSLPNLGIRKIVHIYLINKQFVGFSRIVLLFEMKSSPVPNYSSEHRIRQEGIPVGCRPPASAKRLCFNSKIDRWGWGIPK